VEVMQLIARENRHFFIDDISHLANGAIRLTFNNTIRVFHRLKCFHRFRSESTLLASLVDRVGDEDQNNQREGWNERAKISQLKQEKRL